MYRRVLAALAALLLLIAAPAPARAAASATGAVTGVVLDEGRPAPGITVSLMDSGVETVTDGAGRFQFSGVLPGSYYLIYRTPGGGMTQTGPSFTLEAGAVVDSTDSLGPHGAMAGRILTNKGEPAAGAAVGLTFVRQEVHAETGADGSFLMDYVPPGTYQIWAQRQPAGAPRQYVPRVPEDSTPPSVSIEAGQVYQMGTERLFPVGLLTGRLLGAGVLPYAQVLVDDPWGQRADIADDGSYRQYVTPGDHRLYFSIDSGRAQWATGTTDPAEATVFTVAEDQVIQHDEWLMADLAVTTAEGRPAG